MKTKMDIKKMCMVAMLAALSYGLMVVGRIPLVLFLKYDPKDIVITIGGFMYGPLTAFLMSIVVATLEMFTVSTTGIIGWVMNVLSSTLFACTASAIYKKYKTKKSSLIGLIVGGLITTAVMLLWNYIVTPYYMGYPRQAVVELILPAFLPFNLLKNAINAALTFLVYVPVSKALEKDGLIEEQPVKSSKSVSGLVLVSVGILATSVLSVLAINKII